MTPGDRAQFVHHVNVLADIVNVESLRLVSHGCVEFEPDGVVDIAAASSAPTIVGWRHTAMFTGEFLPGEERQGRQFTLEIVFGQHNSASGTPGWVNIEKLWVGIRPINPNSRSEPGDVQLDILNYHYDTGIAGMRHVAIPNFPVAWRGYVAYYAVMKVLCN